MLLSVAIGLVALLGLAFVTPHWAWLFVWLAIGGAANALAHPASNGFIVDQVAVQRRAFAFGLKQAAIPAATLAAGLSVPILALTVGWQWAYVGAAAGAVILVAALAIMVPHKSRSAASETRIHRVGARLPRQLRTFLLATALVSGLGSAAGILWEPSQSPQQWIAVLLPVPPVCCWVWAVWPGAWSGRWLAWRPTKVLAVR
jgi:MFS family permease